MLRNEAALRDTVRKTPCHSPCARKGGEFRGAEPRRHKCCEMKLHCATPSERLLVIRPAREKVAEIHRGATKYDRGPTQSWQVNVVVKTDCRKELLQWLNGGAVESRTHIQLERENEETKKRTVEKSCSSV